MDYACIGCATAGIGITHLNERELEQAETVFEKHKILIEKHNIYAQEHLVENNLGLVDYYRSQYDQAENHFQTAKTLSPSLNLSLENMEFQCGIYGNLGLVHLARGQLASAEAMFLAQSIQAETLSRVSRNKSAGLQQKAIAKTGLAHVNLDKKQLVEAINQLKKVTILWKKLNKKRDAMLITKKRANLYIKIGNKNDACKYFQMFTDIERQVLSKDGLWVHRFDENYCQSLDQ